MFPKKNRLTKRRDILLVLKNGRRITTGVCNIYFLSVDLREEVRISVVVSKMVSKSAVVRNKVKRIFREILRHKLDALSRGLRIVIVAKKEVLEVERGFVEGALAEIF